MGARSDVAVVDQPWPVVYNAFAQTLPTIGLRVVRADAERGHLELETRGSRITVAVGAVDAITTEWVATAEQKYGVLPARHDRRFTSIRDALDRYLATYY